MDGIMSYIGKLMEQPKQKQRLADYRYSSRKFRVWRNQRFVNETYKYHPYFENVSFITSRPFFLTQRIIVHLPTNSQHPNALATDGYVFSILWVGMSWQCSISAWTISQHNSKFKGFDHLPTRNRGWTLIHGKQLEVHSGNLTWLAMEISIFNR